MAYGAQFNHSHIISTHFITGADLNSNMTAYANARLMLYADGKVEMAGMVMWNSGYNSGFPYERPFMLIPAGYRPSTDQTFCSYVTGDRAGTQIAIPASLNISTSTNLVSVSIITLNYINTISFDGVFYYL